MSLVIDLAPEDEAQLTDEAKENGVSLPILVGDVLRRHIQERGGGTQNGHAKPSLFDEWEAEDALMSDEDMRREDELWEKFQANVNETRAALGMRPL